MSHHEALADPYGVLGVEPTASADAIKRAYRKLAARWHPDRNPSDPDAADRFRAVTAAYAVIGEPEARRLYDAARRVAEAQRAGAGPVAVSGTLLQEVGGAMRGMLGGLVDAVDRRWSLGQDLRYTLHLSLADSVYGVRREITFDAPRRCAACDGRGAAGGDPCPACRGEGVVSAPRQFVVEVPPGAESGQVVRLPGAGAPGARGGPPGDLTIILVVDPHPLLTVDGADLRCRAPLPIVTSLAGGSLPVPTLTGPAEIEVPAGVSSGETLRLRGRGLPARGERAAGDLLVTLEIEMPEDLPAEIRRRIAEAVEGAPASSFPRSAEFRRLALERRR